MPSMVITKDCATAHEFAKCLVPGHKKGPDQLGKSANLDSGLKALNDLQATTVALKGAWANDNKYYSWGLYELQSIFPAQFDGHGFLIRDYIRDYTKLQEDLTVHC